MRATIAMAAGLCSVCLIAGCPVESGGERLEVNQTLRNACPFLTDGEIRGVLIANDQDLRDGFSRSSLVADIIDICGETTLRGCSTCFIQIIDQVFP